MLILVLGTETLFRTGDKESSTIRRDYMKKIRRRTNGNMDYERYDRLHQERTDASIGDSERTTEV